MLNELRNVSKELYFRLTLKRTIKRNFTRTGAENNNKIKNIKKFLSLLMLMLSRQAEWTRLKLISIFFYFCYPCAVKFYVMWCFFSLLVLSSFSTKQIRLNTVETLYGLVGLNAKKKNKQTNRQTTTTTTKNMNIKALMDLHLTDYYILVLDQK